MKKLLVLLDRYLKAVACLDDAGLKGRISTAIIEYITTGIRPAADDTCVEAFINLLEPEIIRTLLAVRHPRMVSMKRTADSPQSDKAATDMTNRELAEELDGYVPEGEIREITFDDGRNVFEFMAPADMRRRTGRDMLIDTVLLKRDVRVAAQRIFYETAGLRPPKVT